MPAIFARLHKIMHSTAFLSVHHKFGCRFEIRLFTHAPGIVYRMKAGSGNFWNAWSPNYIQIWQHNKRMYLQFHIDTKISDLLKHLLMITSLKRTFETTVSKKMIITMFVKNTQRPNSSELFQLVQHTQNTIQK